MAQGVVTTETDIKIEQAVLGRLATNPEDMALAATILKPADFSRPVHGVIYSALQKIIAEKVIPDPMKVLSAVRELGEDPAEWEGDVPAEGIAGLEYLITCVETAGRIEDIEWHSRQISRKSNLRQQQHKASEWLQRSGDPTADPEELRAWLTEQLQGLAMETGNGLCHINEALSRQFERMERGKDQRGLTAFSTGFSQLDNVTGGYGIPLFVLLKARRKTGKTQNVIGPLWNCVNAGHAALVISMDTGERITMARLLAYSTGINSFRLNHPDPEDWGPICEATNWWFDSPVWLHQLSGCKVSQIRAYAQGIVAEGHKLGLVIVDFAEKLRPERNYSNREQELSNIGIDLANIREEFGCTVLLLSQVNKEGGERWSQSLGDNSDVILSWKIDDEESNPTIGGAKLTIEGNRVGPSRTISCVYDFGTSRIRETELDYTNPRFPPTWPWWYHGEHTQGRLPE